LEAITLNKFVISSNCPTGPSEILDNGNYGYLTPVNNVDALANKMLKAKISPL
jgi:glycosyltransferase involved in cell wall biosynthesis